MKRKTKIFGLLLLVAVCSYVIFMLGRYSYLITEPEIFLSQQDTWAVKKAREYAMDQGIPEDRLTDPKVIDTVRVYFGGMTAVGGVQITMMKNDGQFLDMTY